MKIKKLITLLLSLTVFMGCFAGCSDPATQHDPAKTVNILISKGGYGDKYLRDVVDQFNNHYAEEGYYVNLLEPREGFGTASALSEMRLGAACGYDLVFPGSVFIYDVVNSSQYDDCVDPITDVFNSTAINFDGTESEKTILETYKADGVDDIAVVNDDGSYEFYGFPMTSSVRGVCVNKSLLRDLTGMDLDAGEYPKTTDEFLDLVEEIMVARDDGQTEAFPIAYGGENAATYSWQSYLTTERQIMGKEEHYENKTWDKYYLENGRTLPQNDWDKVINSYFRNPVIEWTLNVWDSMLAAPGSDGITHDIAHGRVMLGDAVFMFDGEYFYNEVQYSFPDELDDLDIFQHPIHSFVGLKYNLCGAGHNVLTAETSSDAHCSNCDRILSAFCESWDVKAKAVGGVNVNKAEVIAEVATATGTTLTDAQYDALADARGYVYGGYSPMYMIKDCGVEHIAKLFLRMCASQDAANVRTNYGMLHPYYDNEISDEVHPFIQHCMEIDKLGISKYTGNGMGRYGSPRNIGGIGDYGTFGATMGKTSHAIIGVEDHWSERDYAYLAKLFLGSEQCDTYIRNHWNNMVSKASNDIVIPNIYPEYN